MGRRCLQAKDGCREGGSGIRVRLLPKPGLCGGEEEDLLD
jgi:hypothetical protein